MKIRFSRGAMPKYTKKGVTPRRIAAQERKVKKTKESLPLLGDWVDSQTKSPEVIIQNIDEQIYRKFCSLRRKAARDWVRARAVLRSHPECEQILVRWNGSSCPAVGCYLLDMIRQWDKGVRG